MQANESKKTSITGLGLVFGVAIGAGLGIIFENMAIGAGTGESQSRKDESKIQTIGDKRFYSNPE